MPKSKRNKVVALTKVKKKGKEGKSELLDGVQQAIVNYDNTYVVSWENIRANSFKKLSMGLRDNSKFFLGKNKVMQVALGHTPEDECADNAHLLSKYLRGQVCLVSTNLD